MKATGKGYCQALGDSKGQVIIYGMGKAAGGSLLQVSQTHSH